MDINENLSLIMAGGTVVVSIVTQIIVYRENSVLIKKRLNDMEVKNNDNEKAIKELRSLVEGYNQIATSRMQGMEISIAKMGAEITGGFANMNTNLEFIKKFMERMSEK